MPMSPEALQSIGLPPRKPRGHPQNMVRSHMVSFVMMGFPSQRAEELAVELVRYTHPDFKLEE